MEQVGVGVLPVQMCGLVQQPGCVELADLSWVLRLVLVVQQEAEVLLHAEGVPDGAARVGEGRQRFDLWHVIPISEDPQGEQSVGNGRLTDGEPGVLAGIDQQYLGTVTGQDGAEHRPADTSTENRDVVGRLVVAVALCVHRFILRPRLWCPAEKMDTLTCCRYQALLVGLPIPFGIAASGQLE